MKHARALLSDLVERRLWPVAVVLVVALVAVPVVLGRSGGSSAEPVVPPQSAGLDSPASTARAAVSVESAPVTGQRDRSGKVRNPFTQLHVPKAAATQGTPGDATAGGGGSTGGGSTGTGGSSTSTKPAETPSVKLRFGQTDGELTLRKDVARLTALPSTENPFLVFLGVLEDGKTAVFLLSSDATVTGDGTCRPSKDDCQTIELQEDETEFFDVVVEGVPVQYQLDLVDIDLGPGGSGKGTAAAARAAIVRHSAAGAEILRDGHIRRDQGFAGADGYRWIPQSGLLRRLPSKPRAQASAFQRATAASTASSPELPGKPVWHHEIDD